MALFPCSKCGCVEDTALCHFWSARLRQTPAVCSACDPTIGKWQTASSRKNWPKAGPTTSAASCCGTERELEDWLGQPIEVIGKASPSRPHSLRGRRSAA